MNCPKCGAVVAEASFLCPVCGDRLDRGSQEAGGLTAPTQRPASTGEPPPRPAEPAATVADQLTAARITGAEEQEDWLEGPWRYSARAMRGAFLVAGLITALCIALGVFVEAKGWGQGWHLILWILLLAFPVGLWIYQLGVLAYRRLTIRYSLTPYRLFHEEGLLVRRKHVIEVIDIDDIDHTQSLWERFVCGDVGTITIHSSDPGTPVLVIRGLANHEEVFRKIDDARRKQRQKRGLKAI